MPRVLVAYVHFIDGLNRRIGRFAMYVLYAIMASMLVSRLTNAAAAAGLGRPRMAQFTLVAYYMLGAPWALQTDVNVRMDLIYGRLSHRGRALTDVFTVFCLMFYLGVMLYGAFDSTVYSFEMSERNPTAWRPVLWPVKSVITLAFGLMLLQAVALLIRDLATLRGVKL